VALALLLCWPACRHADSQREPDLTTTEPPAVRRIALPDGAGTETAEGCVLTVVTRIAENAPAALLDEVAALDVELVSAQGGTDALYLPVRGSGILSLPQARGRGILRVRVLDPQQEVLADRTVDVFELGGVVGVVGLELGPQAERRACGRCSEPGLLAELPDLDFVGLFLSTGAEVAPAHAPLHVAFRAVEMDDNIEALVNTAGAVVMAVEVDGDRGLTWVVAQPFGPNRAVDVALGLARRDRVKGIELHSRTASGELFPPDASPAQEANVDGSGAAP
jgi:hypothetical protein